MKFIKIIVPEKIYVFNLNQLNSIFLDYNEVTQEIKVEMEFTNNSFTQIFKDFYLHRFENFLTSNDTMITYEFG